MLEFFQDNLFLYKNDALTEDVVADHPTTRTQYPHQIRPTIVSKCHLQFSVKW